MANFDKLLVQDEIDPAMVWVPLHVAQLCRCGHSFKSLTQTPTQNTAYAVFYPQGAGHIFADPDLKSFIQTTNEFKNMVDTLAGVQLDVSQADTPQLFVALNQKLQFITARRAGNETFRCHYNECTHSLMQSFKEIAEKEKILIETYKDLASLKMQPKVSPLATTNPTPTSLIVTVPSEPLESQRHKRNVWDLFFGQSTATLAGKVIMSIYYTTYLIGIK